MATKTARKQVERKVNKAVGGGKDMIGIISYWSLEGVRIKVEDLRKLFEKHDLDQDAWFPPHIQGGTAFRKALRGVKKDFKGYILRPITEDDDKIIWGVVREDVDEGNADLEYECEAKVAYVKKTESVHISKNSKGRALALAEAVKEQFEELTETYVNWDIQRMLKRNIGRGMHSITLRRGGGFYFTPPQHLGVIEKHQAVVEDIGGSDMGIIVVTEDDRNKRTIGNDTKRSLEDDLNDVREEIERFKTKSPREATLQRRLEEFKALKSKCDMYAQMLSIKVDDIKQGVDDCAEQVKALIGQVTTSSEDKPKKAKPAAKAKGNGAPAKAKGNGAPAKKTTKKAPAKKTTKKKPVRRVRKVKEEATA